MPLYFCPKNQKNNQKKVQKYKLKPYQHKKNYISKTLLNNVLTPPLQKNEKKNLLVQNKVVYLHRNTKDKQQFKTAADSLNTGTETMTTKIIDRSEAATKISVILLIAGFASMLTTVFTCSPVLFASACFLIILAITILIAVDNNKIPHRK